MKENSLNTYSHYVRLMKVILCSGILISITLTFGWPYLHSTGREAFSLIDTSLPEIQEKRMMHPHYVSTDEKGQPFYLTAEWAKQKTEDFSDLLAPQGSVSMIEGDTFNVTSKKGVYDSQKKILTLEDDVTLISSDGYNIKTEKAHVIVDDKIIEGNHYIEGEGPKGAIKGEKGFKVETRPQGKKVITLKGRSRVVINNEALKKNKESDVQ